MEEELRNDDENQEENNNENNSEKENESEDEDEKYKDCLCYGDGKCGPFRKWKKDEIDSVTCFNSNISGHLQSIKVCIHIDYLLVHKNDIFRLLLTLLVLNFSG